ncbi:phosphatidylethanolamine binding protein [Heterobasidion irregulare TC 32-1]|uniref:Phosphatidylethanolamine binding protein n=1 Tax=Heterobasidion irregulare (strain TC 32-1) TaxID=747525 RepID=W4KD89_HETIT|nr:phosphatidylethanolamine binding protein [Heterobasidion irregulare TC 32-1]ETW83719.1 phosphatidylethanolamine binding protein [Heterobasidion irregulare TC 32-1]
MLSYFAILAFSCWIRPGGAQVDAASLSTVKSAFETSKVVPDVIPSFDPTALLDVVFVDPFTNDTVHVTPGMELTANREFRILMPAARGLCCSANEPLAETANKPQFFVSFSDNSVAEQTFVLAMVDPDAPTPQNRSLSQIRHFLAGDIKVAGGSSNHSQLVNASVPLTAYLNPSPPAGSDAHRYTILLFPQPDNFDHTALDLVNASVDASRLSFNLTTFASSVGMGSPLAGTFFLTKGPTADSTTSGTAAASNPASAVAPSASGGTGNGNANGAGASRDFNGVALAVAVIVGILSIAFH